MNVGRGQLWTCFCGTPNVSPATRCARCGLARPDAEGAAAEGGATSPPEPTGARLVGLGPDLSGVVIPLSPEKPVTIGRELGNDVTLDRVPLLADRHARIYRVHPYFAVEDLGSNQGVVLNGAPVPGHAVLRHGDELRMGEAQFRFEDPAAAPPLRPEPPAAPFPPVPPPLPGPSYAPHPAPYVVYHPVRPQKDRVIAGLLAIFLGWLGIHFFYLNQPKWGLAFLAMNLPFCIGTIVTAPLSILQGILYLASTDEDFQRKYVDEQRFF
ncbi:MAG: FHA domain-containing protein [Armatimonadota bacterium]